MNASCFLQVGHPHHPSKKVVSQNEKTCEEKHDVHLQSFVLVLLLLIIIILIILILQKTTSHVLNCDGLYLQVVPRLPPITVASTIVSVLAKETMAAINTVWGWFIPPICKFFIGGGSLGLLHEWPESTVAIGFLLQTKSSKSPTESDANRSCAMPWSKLLTHIVSTMLVWGPIITIKKQIAEPTFEPLCGSEHYLIPSTGQSGHFPFKRMARTGDTQFLDTPE